MAMMIVIVKVPADRRSRIRVGSADRLKRIIDHVQERGHLRLPLLKTLSPVLARMMILMTSHARHHVHRHHVERREHLLDLRVALPLLLQLRQTAAPFLLRHVSQQELDVEVLDRALIHVAAIHSSSHVLDLHADPMELHEVGPLRGLANREAAWLDAVEVPCVRIAAAGDVLRIAREASVARHPLVVVRIVDRSLGDDLARLPVKGSLAGDAKHLAAVSHGGAVGQLESVVSVQAPSVIRSTTHSRHGDSRDRGGIRDSRSFEAEQHAFHSHCQSHEVFHEDFNRFQCVRVFQHQRVLRIHRVGHSRLLLHLIHLVLARHSVQHGSLGAIVSHQLMAFVDVLRQDGGAVPEADRRVWREAS